MIAAWLSRNWAWGMATATALAAIIGHCARPGCGEWLSANAEGIGAWAGAMLAWGAAAVRAAKAGESIPEPPKTPLPKPQDDTGLWPAPESEGGESD